ILPKPRGPRQKGGTVDPPLIIGDGLLDVKRMGRGYAWLDTGTHASLLDAGNFVRTLSQRQGMQTGSLDEIAYDKGWIDRAALLSRAARFGKNAYGAYLEDLAKE
ncbi:MAG: glucose-1-phosphate thymidylyltransferase, partial [Pseudomonadota bacterium]